MNLPENEQLREKLSHKFADYYNYIKIKKVEKTNSAIRAIHLALDLKSFLTWNDIIYDYLETNFRAMERGVKITRIFFTSKEIATHNGSMLLEVARVLEKQMDKYILIP